RVAPVRGHLPATGRGIISRAYALQQHFVRSRTQGQAKRTVTIIRIEPVVFRLQGKRRRNPYGLVTRPRDLEKDLLLALEEYFPIIHTPGCVHPAIDFDQLLMSEALVSIGFVVNDYDRLGVCFG